MPTPTAIDPISASLRLIIERMHKHVGDRLYDLRGEAEAILPIACIEAPTPAKPAKPSDSGKLYVTARGEPDLPALSAYLRQVGRDLAADPDPQRSACVMDWADVVDDMHALIMYLVDAHRSGEVDEASVCTVGESGGTPAARALQLLKLAMSRGAFSVLPRTVSEDDAYQLLRISNIVSEDARARHGDLPGEPSWGVVADSVLAHTSQHRLAREILKVPENRTLDQHVSLLTAGMAQADGAHGVTPPPNRAPLMTTIVVPPLTSEIASWFRRVILGAHYVPQAKLYEGLSAQDEAAYVRGMCSAAIVRVRQEMLSSDELKYNGRYIEVGPNAPRHPNGEIVGAARKTEGVEVEQIAIQTATTVMEELAPRADAKALIRAHAMGRQMLRVVVAANLAADVLAVIETAIGDALSDRVGYLSVEREPGRPPDDYTVDSEHGFTDGEFTETWGWEIESEHGGPFGDEAAAIDDAWRDYAEVYEMEKDE